MFTILAVLGSFAISSLLAYASDDGRDTWHDDMGSEGHPPAPNAQHPKDKEEADKKKK